MSAFVVGRRSAGPCTPFESRGLLSRVVLVSALALCGCASHPETKTSASVVYPARVAASGVVEIEDDGLPAQAPPAPAIRQIPDDPSEPFSRNYGGPNPSIVHPATTGRPVPARVPTPVIPHDLPPAFRRQLAQAMDQSD